jgi:hypothetical protein
MYGLKPVPFSFSAACVAGEDASHQEEPHFTEAGSDEVIVKPL